MKLIYTGLIVIILLTVTHIKIHEYNLSKYPKIEVGQEWAANADTHEKFHAIILNVDEELVEYEYTVRELKDSDLDRIAEAKKLKMIKLLNDTTPREPENET